MWSVMLIDWAVVAVIFLKSGAIGTCKVCDSKLRPVISMVEMIMIVMACAVLQIHSTHHQLLHMQ